MNEEKKEEIRPGFYQQYNIDKQKYDDNEIEILGYIIINNEKLVIGIPNGNGGNFSPISIEDFFDTISINEEDIPRFKFIRTRDDETHEQKYLRALADYQNLLKQTVKEKEEFAKYALTDFLHNVLPVYDHLKMSMYGLSEEEGKNAWAEGVRLVLKQFKDVLAQHGIEEIKTAGEKFDHNTMDAIDGAGETVKQEVMPGYKLNGKVIRPAKVIVE